MRGKVRIAIGTLVAIAISVSVIFFILTRREASKFNPSVANTNVPVQPAPKRSPAVPAKGAKPPGKPAVAATPDAGSAASEQAWPADGMQVTAHHKGRHGCDGVLILKTAGLQFTCPGDEGKSFFIAVNDIRGTDNDGIVTTSGSKYHFDKLPGGGKDYAREFFASWLSRVQGAQPPVQ